MRARTVSDIVKTKPAFNRAYCFDFDETLATTEARIHVYRKGVFIKSLTSKEYNFYKKNPGDELDFSEFDDGELILKAKKYKIWPVIKNVSNAIKQDRSTSEIYILTARSSIVKSFIYEFLKQNGIDIILDNIITIGDGEGNVNISDAKKKILTELKNKYAEVLFFDDDIKNIELARSIPGIKTKLVESRYV